MMAENLNKKRRLDKLLSLDDNAEARDEASKDSTVLLHARNRGLATSMYSFKRRIAGLTAELGRATASKSQLEDAVSVFHRRLGLLESDISQLLARLDSDHGECLDIFYFALCGPRYRPPCHKPRACCRCFILSLQGLLVLHRESRHYQELLTVALLLLR